MLTPWRLYSKEYWIWLFQCCFSSTDELDIFYLRQLWLSFKTMCLIYSPILIDLRRTDYHDIIYITCLSVATWANWTTNTVDTAKFHVSQGHFVQCNKYTINIAVLSVYTVCLDLHTCIDFRRKLCGTWIGYMWYSLGENTETFMGYIFVHRSIVFSEVSFSVSGIFSSSSSSEPSETKFICEYVKTVLHDFCLVVFYSQSWSSSKRVTLDFT